MSKTIDLRADLEFGVVPTHLKFVGGLVPDDAGKLPRNSDGEFVIVAEMRKLMEESPVAITSVQVPYFGGADEGDVDAFYNGLKDLGLTLHIIMMVGGADPMSADGEDAVVGQLVTGLETAKKFGVKTVSSTSLEEWMDPNAVRKEGADFEAAVKQVVKVHVRAYEEGGVAGSCVEAWNLEFLRGVEFATFTDLGRAWKVAKGANEVIGKKFFKLLIDAAHCGDSALSIDENAAGLRTSDCKADPVRACEVKVGGTVNVLEAVREYGGVERFVFLSTAAVYAVPEGGDFLDEGAATCPLNAYTASKLAAEAMVECYARDYGLRATVLRPQIIYGPSREGEGSTAGVSVAIREAAAGRRYTIPFRGRTFFHFTGDVGRFVGRALLDGGEDFGVFNLPGESMEVEEMVEALNAKFGEGLIDCADVVYPFAEGLDDGAFRAVYDGVEVAGFGAVLSFV